MRVVRLLSIGLGAMVVLLAAAAWIVPPLLDWTRYRAGIEELASRVVGRDVAIRGPVSLRLLPEPTLTAGSVDVAAGGGAAISVAELRVSVGLGGLFEGRVDARDMVLRGLDVRMPWPMDAPPDFGRRPGWLGSASAHVEGGRVSVGDLAITDIDATLATGGLTGSVVVAGGGRFAGRDWHLAARLSQPGSDGSVGIELALDGQSDARGIGATLSGQLAGDGTFAGRLDARGPDLSALFPAPPVPFKAAGRLTVAGGLAAADDLAVEFGGSPALGSVALRLAPQPRLDLALSASRLDLDAWLPVLLTARPPLLPTGLDLSAEAATFAGGTLRRLRGAFDLDETGIDVREASVILPGDATTALTGRITRLDPANPRFEGAGWIKAPALRDTFSWLERAGFGRLGWLPRGVMTSADLSGRIAVGDGEARLEEAKGTVDGTPVGGSVSVRPARDASGGGPAGRMSVSLALTLERLDLDAWLPASPQAHLGLARLLVRPSRSPVDADLRLTVARAALRGAVIAPLIMDARIGAGTIDVRRVEAASGDVQLTAAGSVGADGRVSDGRLDVRAAHLGPVLAAVAPDWEARVAADAPGLDRMPLSAQMSGSGTPDKLSVRATGELGDLRFDARPEIDTRTGLWTGSATLRHPGAPRLAESMGVAGAASWLGDGSLSFVATLSGGPGALSADDFALTAGGLQASGALTLDYGGDQPSIRGSIAATSLALPLPYARAPSPLPWSALTGWRAAVTVAAGHVLIGGSPALDNASARLTLDGATLRVETLSAGLAGGRLSGQAELAAGDHPPRASATLQLLGVRIDGGLLDLPLDVTSGVLDGVLNLSTSGYAPAAMLSTLGGEASVSVREGLLSGIDLSRAGEDASDATARAALAGGSTKFERLDATVVARAGTLTIRSAYLEATSGTAEANGLIDLPRDALDVALHLHPDLGSPPPDVTLRLTGAATAPTKAPELAALARWRIEHGHAETAQPGIR